MCPSDPIPREVHMTIGSLRRSLKRWRIRVARRGRTRNDEAYLSSTPANVARIDAAVEAARKGEGTPISISALRAQYGLEGR